MSRPARSHRHRHRGVVPPPTTPINNPDDAMRIVLAAIAEPRTAETVVLLLDAQFRGGTCLVCRGASTPDQVASLAFLLTQVAAQETTLAAVVLATVRPGDGIAPSATDDATFATMRHDLAGADVDLLDWFLLDGDLVGSVAELTGACWRWAGEEPQW
jgi:DNA repair protein RadC